MTATETRPFDRLCQILDKHNRDAARLIPILQEVQEAYRYLPADVMTFVATALNLPPARVYGVATFYAHFTLEPKGRHVIRLCDGTACHVKQSEPILRALQERLGLNDRVRTTPDLSFTIEVVSCLGACGLAPVVVIDEQVHGQVTPAQAVELVDAIVSKEKEA